MPFSSSRVRALLFDVDGTLRDTDDEFVHTLSRWLQPFKWALPRRDVTSAARAMVMGIEAPAQFVMSLPDQLHLDAPLVRASMYFRRWRDRATHRTFSLTPDIPSAIQQLSMRYPLGIVTLRDEEITREFLSNSRLAPYFRCVATALTCEHAKPYPHQILWCAEQLGVAPDECVVIGDTTVDMRAGKLANAQTVGVLCGFGYENELVRAGADAILKRTADLPQLLTR